MSRKKPTPTPLNDLVMKPGKRGENQLKETQTLNHPYKPFRVQPVLRGGAERTRYHGETNHRRRNYGKENHRGKSPAYGQCGGGGETKKGELKGTQALT